MPFVALAKPMGHDGPTERISIWEYRNPRSDLIGFDLTCPLCGERMSVRQPFGVVAHFWHPDGCVGGEGESLEHEIGKNEVRKYLYKSPDYKGASIDLEHWFADVRRRADVYVKRADGSAEVHEIQLSATTPGELKERTDDYSRSGISNIIWWLGGNADNEINRSWCKSYLGYVGSITSVIRTETATVYDSETRVGETEF